MTPMHVAYMVHHSSCPCHRQRSQAMRPYQSPEPRWRQRWRRRRRRRRRRRKHRSRRRRRCRRRRRRRRSVGRIRPLRKPGWGYTAVIKIIKPSKRLFASSESTHHHIHTLHKHHNPGLHTPRIARYPVTLLTAQLTCSYSIFGQDVDNMQPVQHCIL